MATDVLQDRFEHILQQRHHDIVTPPAGYIGSLQNLESQTVNLAPSDYILPPSPTRNYGTRFENWMNGIPDDESGINPSLSITREPGLQERNKTFSDLNLASPRIGSRNITLENWEGESRPIRISVVSNPDTPHVITRPLPDEFNPNLSGRFDEPSDSGPSAGSLFGDIEMHLYVQTFRI